MSTQPTQQSRGDEPPCKCINLSWSSEDVCVDVACILHPVSELARKAAHFTRDLRPQHLLQNTSCDAPFHNPNQHTHDIALRYSSDLVNPSAGFLFGRGKERSDILITPPQEGPNKVSNVHFRIYLKNDGILMLEDLSTNGTTVDFKPLRAKNAGNRELPSTQMLVSGSQILVISDDKTKSTAEYIVRIPPRDGFEEKHQENFDRFLSRILNQNQNKRGHRLVRSAVSLSSHNYHGMHWSGGDRYNVIGQIGRGTFATVFTLATKTDGKLYACKELERRSVKHNKKWSAVARELNIMERLDHPNIVEFREYHENSSYLYIIMEYVPGGDLSSLLRKQGRIPENSVRIIARQVLHALSYLHSERVTHRDIKPDNILIASMDPLIVKLSDFGLSKMVHEESMLNTFCGTPLYCAPEVYPDYPQYDDGPRKKRKPGPPLMKSLPYDQSVDMWSFGAVLYHILCGIPPYRGRPDDRGALMLHNMMNHDPDYAKLRVAGVSEEGIDFVAGLLKRNPKKRLSEQELFQHPWIVEVPDEFDYKKVDALQLTDVESSSEQKIHTVLEEDEEKDYDNDNNNNDQRRTGQENNPTNHETNAGIQIGDYYQIAHKDSSPPPEASVYKKVRLDENIKKSSISKEGSISRKTKLEDKISESPKARLDENIRKSSLSKEGSFPKKVKLENNISEFPFSPNAPIYAVDVQYPSLPVIHTNDASQEEEAAIVEALPRPIFEDISPNITAGTSATDKRKADYKFLRVNEADPIDDVSSSSNEFPISTPEEADAPLYSYNNASPNVTSSLDLSKFHIGSPHPKHFLKTKREQTAPVTLPSAVNSVANNSSGETTETPQGEPQGGRKEIHDTKQENIYGSVQESQRNGRVSTPTAIADETRNSFSGSQKQQQQQQEQPASPPTRPLYGELIPLSGSIIDTPIPLTFRQTCWGRHPFATVRYPNPMDGRVPKVGLEITFWAPGIEGWRLRGEDWTQTPGLCTILSTRTRTKIGVNGIRLHSETSDGTSRIFGQLYDGDILSIFHDRTGFLKFECRFYCGLSTRKRPHEEAGFVPRFIKYPKDDQDQEPDPALRSLLKILGPGQPL